MKLLRRVCVVILFFTLTGCESKLEYYDLKDYALPDEIIFNVPMYYLLNTNESRYRYTPEVVPMDRMFIKENHIDG